MIYRSINNMREFPNDVQLNTTLCINWIGNRSYTGMCMFICNPSTSQNFLVVGTS